jgi:hypothetical protein
MRCFSIKSALVLAIMILLGSQDSLRGDDKVDFNRDIKPILSNNCYTCHGFDQKQRKAGLRLDTKEGAFAALKQGRHAIVPGDRAKSVLYQKITAADQDDRMPPAETGKSLSTTQVELIGKWIDQGADWKHHWSWIAPQRPPLPDIENTAWPRNAIDAFVLDRLEGEKLAPGSEADKETLIRRVTLDLTGLPPTIDETDAFLADESPTAYESLVDGLLNSSRYGEHMGRYWLDAARYGDTHGLHLDNYRSIWPYRDWVINAFNANMPFDQFTIEQLAGDLLPDPTLDQRIATGFNRCNVSTSEGGSIDEEYYVRYAVDRVETTSTVWLGLSMGCAVCHKHKFDPITQEEFYGLFAFFNSLQEKAMDGNAANPPPVVKVPSRDQTRQLEEFARQITAAKTDLTAPMPEVDAAQAVWEKKWAERLKDQWQLIDPVGYLSTGGASLRKLEDESILAEGFNPDKDEYRVVANTEMTGITAVRLEALTHESLPHNGPGRSENANLVLSEFEAEAVSVKDQNQVRKIEFSVAQADHYQTDGDYSPAKAIDGNVDGSNGWAVEGFNRRENRTMVFAASEPFGFDGGTLLRFRIRHESQFKQHAIGRFRLSLSNDETMAAVRFSDWHVVGPFQAASGDEAYDKPFGPQIRLDLTATYDDGKLKWEKKPEFVDGKVHNLAGENAATYLHRTIHAPSARKLVLSLGSDDGIQVWLNHWPVLANKAARGAQADQDILELDLQAGENSLLMKINNYGGAYAFYFNKKREPGVDEAIKLAPLLATPADKRSDQANQQIRDYYRANYSPEWSAIKANLAQLEQSRNDLDAAIPTTMVMQDSPTPRDAFVLVRGEYDKRGEKVDMGVPASLPPIPTGAPMNRLGLAKWLVDPSNPLTARVTVNRYWQQYFGAGIVKTTEDFGSQGEWPTHPRLLDWLATEFIESGWDIKHMQRLIVTSATYRQSAKMNPKALAIDPENRLLSHGPRFRMDAEMVRDHALAISGLLVPTVGGPSVKPYQPLGLWKAVGYTSSNTANFKPDTGEALYRRGLYTFWKRTSPPPTLLTFDAPSRESCSVRRPRTNTPLQALVLLNDPQYMEAARNLAQRMMTEGGATPPERVTFAFRLATGRRPESDEVGILVEAYRIHLADYKANTKTAEELISIGESKPLQGLETAELAAWTMVANLIMNLDESITKG